MSLPINNNDITHFSECWQKFDCDATGYINRVYLKEFIIMLAQSETQLISEADKKVLTA